MAPRYRTGGRWRRHDGRRGARLDEQGEVGEADRVLAAAALGPQVEADRDRDRGGGRGAARARGSSCGSSCSVGGPGEALRERGEPRAVGGESEVADAEPAELARRATARSAAAASSNAVRSRRSPVSTRSVRPVSGSMRVSSPTSTSASSRGSATSRAMTAWRPATSVRAGTQSRGPRKSETMTTTPGRGAGGADERERAGRRGLAAALLGRFGRERPEEAEHPAAAAGRRRDRSRGRHRT